MRNSIGGVIVENRIRGLRKECKMTQIRLSIELEVSQETVSAYERQEHYPSIDVLIKMRKIFHASSDYILGLSNIRNPIEPKDFNSTELLLIEQFRDLTDYKKERLQVYLEGMLV